MGNEAYPLDATANPTGGIMTAPLKTVPPTTRADFDEAVLCALRQWGGNSVSYVVRNRLDNFGRGINASTAQVLSSLKRLERAGKVRRSRETSYATMICWVEVKAEGAPT
jgi:hypothetical protein